MGTPSLSGIGSYGLDANTSDFPCCQTRGQRGTSSVSHAVPTATSTARRHLPCRWQPKRHCAIHESEMTTARRILRGQDAGKSSRDSFRRRLSRSRQAYFALNGSISLLLCRSFSYLCAANADVCGLICERDCIERVPRSSGGLAERFCSSDAKAVCQK